MITILVLNDSSLQVVIAHQVENHYAKAGMNYGHKCALSENIKNRTKVSISRQCLWCHKGRYLEHQILSHFKQSLLLLISKFQIVKLLQSDAAGRQVEAHLNINFQTIFDSYGRQPTKFNFQTSQI